IFILFSLYNKVIEKSHRADFASAFQVNSNTNPREFINNIRNIPSVQNDYANFIAKFTADNDTIIFELFEKKKLGDSLITAEVLKSKDAITKSITDGNKIIASMNEEIIHKELVQIFSDLEDKFTSQCMQSFNDEAVCNEGKRGFHNSIENNIQIIKEVISMKKDIFEQEIALLQFTKQHYNDLNSHSNKMELKNRINTITKTQENINLRGQQFINQYNQNMKAIFKKHGYSSGQ
ncbi:MAG: hypothetical protein PHR82_09860, partial [Endomicrobiaceae bacterium]|nr:hypothetical protein [Endomicrobiaceae bacterium]